MWSWLPAIQSAACLGLRGGQPVPTSHCPALPPAPPAPLANWPHLPHLQHLPTCRDVQHCAADGQVERLAAVCASILSQLLKGQLQRGHHLRAASGAENRGRQSAGTAAATAGPEASAAAVEAAQPGIVAGTGNAARGSAIPRSFRLFVKSPVARARNARHVSMQS